MSYAQLKILIVDDDLSVIKSISRVLSIEGYHCLHAQSAQKALCLLADERFDLLISDVMMPEVSGNDLLRDVNKRLPDMAVVMISGKDNKETFARCLTDHGYGYLIKPFTDNQLIVSVKNALLIQSLRLENQRLKQAL